MEKDNNPELKHIRLNESEKDWIFPPISVPDDGMTVRSMVKSMEGDDDSVSSWESWDDHSDESSSSSSSSDSDHGDKDDDGGESTHSHGSRRTASITVEPEGVVAAVPKDDGGGPSPRATGYLQEKRENLAARQECVEGLSGIMKRRQGAPSMTTTASCASVQGDGDGDGDDDDEYADDDLYNVINSRKYAQQHENYLQQVIQTLEDRHPSIFESSEFLNPDGVVLDGTGHRLNGLVAEILGTDAPPSTILKRMQGILEHQQDRFTNIANSVLAKKLLGMDKTLMPHVTDTTSSACPPPPPSRHCLQATVPASVPVAASAPPPDVMGDRDIKSLLSRQVQQAYASPAACDQAYDQVLIRNSSFFKDITEKSRVKEANVHWVMDAERAYVKLCPKTAPMLAVGHQIMDMCVRATPWLKIALEYILDNKFPSNMFEQRKGAAEILGFQSIEHYTGETGVHVKKIIDQSADTPQKLKDVVDALGQTYEVYLSTPLDNRSPEAVTNEAKIVLMKFQYHTDFTTAAKERLVSIWRWCDTLQHWEGTDKDLGAMVQRLSAATGLKFSKVTAATSIAAFMETYGSHLDLLKQQAALQLHEVQWGLDLYASGFRDQQLRTFLYSLEYRRWETDVKNGGLRDLCKWVKLLDESLQRALPHDKVSFWESIVCQAFDDDKYSSCLAFLVLVQILSWPVSRPLRLLLNVHEPLFALVVDIVQTKLATLPIRTDVEILAEMLFNASKTESLLTYWYTAEQWQASILPFKHRSPRKSVGSILASAPMPGVLNPTPPPFPAPVASDADAAPTYIYTGYAPSSLLVNPRAVAADATIEDEETNELRWTTLAKMFVSRWF